MTAARAVAHTPDLRFRKAQHVRRRADFEQAYNFGVKVSGRLMTVFVRPNAEPAARLGIAATRKIGGAVVRNRAKRLARELFRHHRPAASVDVIVIPRREFLDAPLSDLEREFTSLVDRARRRPLSAGPRRDARPRRDPRV